MYHLESRKKMWIEIPLYLPNCQYMTSTTRIFINLPYYIRSNLRCICNNMLKYNFLQPYSSFETANYILLLRLISLLLNLIQLKWHSSFLQEKCDSPYITSNAKTFFFKDIKITTISYSTLNIFYCQATIQTMDQTQVIN